MCPDNTLQKVHDSSLNKQKCASDCAKQEFHAEYCAFRECEWGEKNG